MTTHKKQQDMDNDEGQLALDIYQTDSEIIVIAPIAGVTPDDIDISVTEEVLTIKGKRDLNMPVEEENYFTKECFWGRFSRSIVLPESAETSDIKANFKNGVLTLSIPKVERAKTQVIRIKES